MQQGIQCLEVNWSVLLPEGTAEEGKGHGLAAPIRLCGDYSVSAGPDITKKSTESSAHPAGPGKTTRMRMKIRIGRVVGSISLCALCLTIAALIQREQTQALGRTPVIVELFTSEGCSSCPSADELLAELDKSRLIADAEIVPLELHVDYWNELGWVDPFSSSLFTERQNTYARAFGNGRIYTPQMVVDGGAEFVGSNSGRAYEAIRRAAQVPKAAIHLTGSREEREATKRFVSLRIQIQGLASVVKEDTAEILLAITEDGLSSKVLRGENSGRKLSHTGVVRRLEVIGKVNPGEPDIVSLRATAHLEVEWKRERLRAVVLLQERGSKHVIGAASSSL